MKRIKEVARDVFAEGSVYEHKVTNKEIAQIKDILANTTMTVKDMNKETGMCWRVDTFPSKNNKFAKIKGRYWYFKVTDKGNVIDYMAIIDSIEKKYGEIPKHEDEEYHTYSDIGCYLINGMLFRTGHGDGTNTVVVRNVEEEGKYYTRAEIHDRIKTSFIPADKKVRIWRSDCDDINKVKPMLEVDNVLKVQLSDTKLYVIKKVENKN